MAQLKAKQEASFPRIRKTHRKIVKKKAPMTARHRKPNSQPNKKIPTARR